ncbi:MAG: type II toxin-antitoxin system PemK/MazF family toxin [Chloroflexota bacterium]|nr:type II toxin-antitoxin system PemK/MazF family toxin [Chloroflexota bacterium]MDE2896057.1 type II toxin-antitoxin system PemK/MazF family toxin [Chloroflexota bacterium]
MTELVCGDIWFVEGGGDYLNKGRPAVVLHNNEFRSVRSVTVCLLTSNTDSASDPLLRVPIRPSLKNGLERPSWLMVDKIQTVRRSRLKQRIGEAETDVIDAAIELATPFLNCQSGSLTTWRRLRRLLRISG